MYSSQDGRVLDSLPSYKIGFIILFIVSLWNTLATRSENQ